MSKKFFKDGDEIILSLLEHHANIIPWHLIDKKINIRPLSINETGDINYKDLKNIINPKTKLITLTHMSNVTGSITDTNIIKDLIKKNNIPLLLMDVNLHHTKKLILKNWILIFMFFQLIKCMDLQV